MKNGGKRKLLIDWWSEHKIEIALISSPKSTNCRGKHLAEVLAANLVKQVLQIWQKVSKLEWLIKEQKIPDDVICTYQPQPKEKGEKDKQIYLGSPGFACQKEITCPKK